MRGLLLAVALALLAGACSKLDAPADPVWGKQPCAHCAMVVGDRRYAAQLVADGERRFFDDLGCMAQWMEEHRAAEAPAWVRDAQGGWTDARKAHYAPGAKTPMDYGFEARADGGLDWLALRTAVAARARRAGER